ncbi:hypothetical protein LXL04_027939 [Taraxacum kok-saghyz]
MNHIDTYTNLISTDLRIDCKYTSDSTCHVLSNMSIDNRRKHCCRQLLYRNLKAGWFHQNCYLRAPCFGFIEEPDRIHAAETLSHTHKHTKEIKQEGTQGFYVVRIRCKSYVHGLQLEFILTHKDYKLVIHSTLVAHINFLT